MVLSRCLRSMVLVALVLCAFGVYAEQSAENVKSEETSAASAATPGTERDAASAVARPGTTNEASIEPSAAQPPKGGKAHRITVWDMIVLGGSITWVIMGFGVVAFAMIIYFWLTLTTAREVPPNFVKRAQTQIRAGDLRGAYQMCEDRDELVAHVLRAGIRMYGHDRYVIQEAMESEGERGATALWQKISYLNSIAVISPLLGLLGTVWGMILAFSTIAYEDAQVKSTTMAENVSLAMITTLAGLIVAIPAMLFYFYFRGRVIKIIAAVEARASEFIEMLARGQNP